MTLTSTTLPVPGFESEVELIYGRHQSSSSDATNILCLPFWGGSATLYRGVLDQLNALTAESQLGTFAALSYPGTGNAAAPATDTAEFHAPLSRAEQLASVLQSEGFLRIMPATRSLIIVAHSASAKAAYELCAKLSGVSNSPFSVSSLLLLGPAPPGPFELPPEVRDQAKTAYDTLENATWAIANNLIASTSTHNNAETVEALAKVCFGMSPGAKRGWPELGMKYDCRPAAAQVSKRWPMMNVSILVGSEDRPEPVEKVKRETIQILREIGFNVKETIIEGCGHLIPVERPDKIVQEIKNLML